MIADSGERYRSKQFNKQWLAEKGIEPKCSGLALDFVEAPSKPTKVAIVPAPKSA